MMRIILLLFLLAVAIRFLYFPDNVYFAYDQARDSYTSLEILKGDIKIVGPPSVAGNNLFAGPLIYYIYAPIYFLFDKNPEAVSLFLRIINASGIFLTFAIATILFSKNVGLISSLFYAFSYEQTQYSIFLSHQPQAVIPVLLFYLGLSLIVFKNKTRGFLFTAVGAGLAIQFHYLYLYLIIILSLTLVLFQKINLIKTKEAFYSLIIFTFLVSTYIISEIKFGARTVSSFLESAQTSGLHIKETAFILNRFIYDNLLANYSLTIFIGILFLGISFYFLSKKETGKQILFLLIWLLTSIIPHLFSGTPSYYYSAGTNVSILIFVSFVISKLPKKYSLVALAIMIGVIYNNLYLIQRINPQGPNNYTVIQPEMLTRDEKKILDYIYQNADGKEFATRALTVPLDVNTTWSYIFEWYGKRKYGYLPIWTGPIANGYAGIKSENDRSKLPKTQFLIIEPTSGIRPGIIENFFKEETYFTRVIEERQFGTLRVQKRQKI